MKGIRFYEELEHKNRKAEKSKGTVVAVFYENGSFQTQVAPNKWEWAYEALAGLYDEPNSIVCSSSVPWIYLRTQCRRISEARAREIHPLLFERLDMED